MRSAAPSWYVGQGVSRLPKLCFENTVCGAWRDDRNASNMAPSWKYMASSSVAAHMTSSAAISIMGTPSSSQLAKYKCCASVQNNDCNYKHGRGQVWGVGGATCFGLCVRQMQLSHAGAITVHVDLCKWHLAKRNH